MALPKVINILRFDVGSQTCPQELRLILRENIRDVFKRRNGVKNVTLSNHGIDALLELWWKRHRNIISAASLRPEWDWKTLSLLFDQNVSRPVNFKSAFIDYKTLLGRADCGLDADYYEIESDSSCVGFIRGDETSGTYLGYAADKLFKIYIQAFRDLILEGQPIKEEYTDEDAKISVATVERVKNFIEEYKQEFTDDDKTITGCFFTIQSVFSMLDSEKPIPFNKLPKAIYDKACSFASSEERENFLSDYTSCIGEHINWFLGDLYKSVGANQASDTAGPVKTTIVNKLVKSFHDWLTALTVDMRGNRFVEGDDFNVAVSRIKTNFSYYSNAKFKVRNVLGEGFTLVNRGTYEQLFARLQENVKGSFCKESFIVSFHPCDMITCSLGYSWSSCQSFIDDFTDLPAKYGQGSNYGGGYNRGNFQFLCANGFIVYIPHEKLEGVPQYLWAKKKRCLLWVGDNLDCIRQNDFYPGHPYDQESIALAKVIREYLQDVFAPFNFSNGTVDWKAVKGSARVGKDFGESLDRSKFEEIADDCDGRYNDPIMALSYLKGKTEKATYYYAVDFPKLDTGVIRPCSYSDSRGYSSFVTRPNCCRVCGKALTTGNLCPKCESELIEHNGQMVHPSDLVCINTEDGKKYFDITELDKLGDYVTTEEGINIKFKSAYKVIMPSGIKYFKVLPDYAEKCSVCGEYFHKSLMIGEVCIAHFNSAIASRDKEIQYDIKDVISLFIKGSLSFDCNDTDKLLTLLGMLEEKNIKWVSGCKATDYVPRTDSAKRMYLSKNSKGLIISSKPKSTVIRVSNLVVKGGE